MTRLMMSALALIPLTAQAHGVHPPVPATAHGAAHGLPLAALALIALAALVAWRTRS